jgi:hypothetical protein
LNKNLQCCEEDVKIHENKGEWEKFEVERRPGNKIIFKSHRGSYLKANDDLSCRFDAYAVGEWETWTMENHADGLFALRSHHGRYLGFFEDHAKADIEHANAWEKFRLDPVPGAPMQPPMGMPMRPGMPMMPGMPGMQPPMMPGMHPGMNHPGGMPMNPGM